MQISEVYNSMRSKLRGLIVGTNTAPLSLSDIEETYGNADAFLIAYKEFEEEFTQAVLDTNAGRNAPITTPGEDLFSKGIDFSMIKDHKVRRRLQDKYKRKILRLTGSTDADGQYRPGLLERGMPTVTTPSSNPYRGSLRYLVDGTDEGGDFVHPAQILLSRMNLTFNPDGPQGLESIGFGGKIMSSAQLSSAFASGGGVMRPVAGGLRRVVTLDIETTGVDAASVARTLAVSESYIDDAGRMVDAQGNEAGPRVISNVFLDVDQLHGQTVTQSGMTRSLSDFLIEEEITGVPGSAVARTEPEMLDALEGLLRELNSADTVVTYNARFDVSKLLQTIEGFDGYRNHEGLMAELDIFKGNLQKEGFISDQLLTMSNYLQQQAIEIMKDENPEIFDDSILASNRFQELLYGRSAGLPGEVGEGLKYAGVTQVADNTNLLDLIRRDAPEVFNEIHSGSHIASTDVIIEDYIRKYMESGELRLDELERKDIVNGAADAATSYLNDSEISRARNIIRRSSAINATTDIANPRVMSDLVFRSITENEKMLQRTAVEATIQEPAIPYTRSDGTVGYRNQTGRFTSAPQPMTGVFAYNQETGTFELYNAQGDQRFSSTTASRGIGADELESVYGMTQDDIRAQMRQTLEAARQGDDVALDAVVKTGINYGTASKVDRAQNLNLLNIGRRAQTVTADTLTDENIIGALGGVYETYGSRPRQSSSRGSMITFAAGFGRYTEQAAAGTAEAFARIGYGYIGEPEERVVSTILARHTSGLGRSIEQAAVSAIEAAAGNITNAMGDVRFASRASDLVEMGLTYFKAGTKYNVRNMLDDSSGLSNKLIIPLQIVEEAVSRAVDAGDIAADKVMLGGRVSLDDIGFSFGDVRRSAAPDDVGRGVNVVWGASRSLSQDESRALAEQLLDIFSDADEVRNILNLSVDEDLGPALNATIGAVEQQLSPGQAAQAAGDGRQAAVDIITRRLKDDVVIGSLDIDESQTLELEADLNRVGIDTSTDVIGGSRRTRILRSGMETEAGNVGVLAPVRDREVLERMGDEAVDLVRDTDEKYLRVVGDIAERIDESPELGKAVTKKISRAVDGNIVDTVAEIYKNNKKKTVVGLGIAAASAIGYYGYRRYQESSVYDETLEEQPYEDRLNKYSLGESYSLSGGRRMDPMETTSVVNNLNNRKINHTNMSNGKNDHLFSGAF
jgi:hypothetical protein